MSGVAFRIFENYSKLRNGMCSYGHCFAKMKKIENCEMKQQKRWLQEVYLFRIFLNYLKLRNENMPGYIYEHETD